MFGLFLGFATLGKYPVLALIPMVLLLVKPKKIAYAALLFVVAIAPWLIFSQIFFGNAILSYPLSFNITLANAQTIGINPLAFAAMFEYPVVFLVVGLLVTHRRWSEIAKAVRKRVPRGDFIKKMYNDDKLYLYAILLVFFVISLAETLYVASHYDFFTQARYGYLSSIAATLLVAVVLNDLRKYARINIVALSAVLSIILVLFTLVAYLLSSNSLVLTGVKNPVYQDAVSTLTSLGYQNCRIVTNDWVYMMYYNISAFSEFDPNTTAASQYPILIFHNNTAATQGKLIPELNQSKLVYASYNYSILLPPIHKCYTGNIT
jgi:hypothetical protein